MAGHGVDPTEQVPEADLLEQQAPLDPRLTDADTVPVLTEPLQDGADEADRVEQHTEVAGEDEEDYPSEPSPVGWT